MTKHIPTIHRRTRAAKARLQLQGQNLRVRIIEAPIPIVYPFILEEKATAPTKNVEETTPSENVQILPSELLRPSLLMKNCEMMLTGSGGV